MNLLKSIDPSSARLIELNCIIAIRVNRFRILKGMTVEDLSEKSKMDLDKLKLILNGGFRGLSISDISDLSCSLGIKFDDIIEIAK